jgi:proline racemase
MGSGVGYRDIAMLLLGMALAVARPLGANEATPGMTTVHAATPWYQARPEAEQRAFSACATARPAQAGGRPCGTNSSGRMAVPRSTIRNPRVFSRNWRVDR